MKVTVFFICIFLSLNVCWSQNRVGINTNTPEEALDVNGNIVLRGPLQIGGNDSTPGDSGEAGQILTSNGDGMAEWSTINTPMVKIGNYFLYNTYIAKDNTGVTIPAGTAEPTYLINQNAPLDNTWLILDNLTLDIEVPKIVPSKPQTLPLSKLGVSLLVKTQSKDAGGAVVIGLFIDGSLEAASSTVIVGGGADYPVSPLMLKILVEDISAGNHKLQVATKRVYSTSETPIAVGTALVSPGITINPFMMTSAFLVDILALNVE